MNDKVNKKANFIYIAFKKSLKILALSLVLFVIIFSIFFMNKADEDGLALYYKIKCVLVDYRNWFKPRPYKFNAVSYSFNSVQTNWYPSDPNYENVSSFKIIRAVSGRNKFEFIANLPKTEDQYLDKNVAPNTVYVYKLTACNFLRCSEPQTKEVRTYNAPPLPPSELAAKSISPYEVELSWKDNSDHEKGFEIESEIKRSYYSVGKTGPDQTKFVVSEALPGQFYKFRVKAFDGYYASENNPVISLVSPDLERTGTRKFLPGIANDLESASFAKADREWGMAFSEIFKNPRVKKEEMEFNTEIYFMRISAGLEPIGKKVRISFYPGESGSPSLAWNGEKYGVVWTDSRNAQTYDCDGTENCDMHREIFFSRISPGGQRIGDEVRVTGKNNYTFYPYLFWMKDRYVLFFLGNQGIYYAYLDRDGHKINEPKRIIDKVDESREFSVIQSGDVFALAWMVKKTINSPNRADRADLYFSIFAPEKDQKINPIAISGICFNDRKCTDKPDDPLSSTIFWTGHDYGICWGNFQSDIIITLISGKTLRPYSRYKVLNGYSLSPKCVWSGSEIGLISVKHGWVTKNEINFAVFSETGSQITKEYFLISNKDSNVSALSQLYWSGKYFFLADQKSVIVIKP